MKSQTDKLQAGEFPWRRVLVKTVLLLGSMVGMILGPSRDWSWPAAWFVIFTFMFVAIAPGFLYISAHNPGLILERERFLKNVGTATFDKYLLPVVAGLTLVRYLAAGLQHWRDMQQPGWSPTPLLSATSQLLAAAGFVIGCMLQTYSVCCNKYFSSVVRIQSDRGHKVCSDGPYAWVRHPGYVAFSLQGLSEALLLQSSWAMACAVAKTAGLILRTVYEDAFLQQSLPGYAAYAQKVRYRWVPLLW